MSDISYEVKENVLSADHFQLVSNFLFYSEIWKCLPYTADPTNDINDKSLQCNLFNYEALLIPFFNTLNIKELFIARANCNFNRDKHYKTGFHTDINHIPDNCFTSVFYVNTNNGGTQLGGEYGFFIPSVANSLVEFPTSTLHAGVWQTDVPFRYVINLSYTKT